MQYILLYFSVLQILKQIPKSKKGIENWTFFNFVEMSKIENPKKVSKTPHFFTFRPLW